jgi:hypothetical protein
MRQEKPFAKGKDGLRDALIWDTIIELMRREQEHYVFITNNVRDFPSSSEQYLGTDAEGRTLSFASDLNDFLDTHKEFLNRLADLTADLRRDKTLGDFDLEQELENIDDNVLPKIAAKLALRAYSLRDVEGPFYISSYGGPEDIEITDVYGLPEELIVECTATYDCTVEGYVYKWDAFDSDAFVVTDHDWNEHYAEVEFHRDVSVTFLIGLRALDREDTGEQINYESTAVDVHDVEDVTPED